MIPAVLSSVASVVKAGPELARLRKATDAFETQFVKQLVTEMRKSSKSEFADEPGSDIYDEMSNQVLAEKIAARGGFGISKTMFNQLTPRVLAEQAQRTRKAVPPLAGEPS